MGYFELALSWNERRRVAAAARHVIQAGMADAPLRSPVRENHRVRVGRERTGRMTLCAMGVPAGEAEATVMLAADVLHRDGGILHWWRDGDAKPSPDGMVSPEETPAH